MNMLAVQGGLKSGWQSPELLRDIHRLKRGFGATLEKVNPGVNAISVNTVRCGDCQHFQRTDYPHTGRCAQGLSWAEIADQWNDKGVPTVSGIGKWHGAAVAKLVRRVTLQF